MLFLTVRALAGAVVAILRGVGGNKAVRQVRKKNDRVVMSLEEFAFDVIAVIRKDISKSIASILCIHKYTYNTNHRGITHWKQESSINCQCGYVDRYRLANRPKDALRTYQSGDAARAVLVGYPRVSP